MIGKFCHFEPDQGKPTKRRLVWDTRRRRKRRSWRIMNTVPWLFLDQLWAEILASPKIFNKVIKTSRWKQQGCKQAVELKPIKGRSTVNTKLDVFFDNVQISLDQQPPPPLPPPTHTHTHSSWIDGWYFEMPSCAMECIASHRVNWMILLNKPRPPDFHKQLCQKWPPCFLNLFWTENPPDALGQNCRIRGLFIKGIKDCLHCWI